MTTTINIGGKDRAIRVDYSVFYHYEVRTGRSAQADAVYFSAENFSIQRFADFVFCALASPIWKAGATPDFDAADVADWVMSDPASMDALGRIIGDAFGSGAKTDEAEKKPKAVAPKHGTTE